MLDLIVFQINSHFDDLMTLFYNVLESHPVWRI